MGLGDKTEMIIKKVTPKLHEKKKDCKSCRKRKVILNNIGAIFSN